MREINFRPPILYKNDKGGESMTSNTINTVEEAVRFLKSIGVEAVGTVFGWGLSDGDDFEMTCEDNAALIDHARYERDMVQKLEAEGAPVPLPDFLRSK